MATLQAVNYSMNGEPLQKQKLGKDFAGLVTYPVDEKTGKIIYPTGKDWYVFKLVDNNKKGGVRLPTTDDVINPETKRTERIRLLNGVDSVWLKDQKDLPKDYEKSNWVELRFFRNQKMLRVSKNHQTALEFLRLTNNNIGNPNRIMEKGSRHQFFEYDSAMAEREAYARDEFELEMAIIAKQTPFAEMKKHAGLLGISMTNSATGEPKGEDGIRKEYVMYAKRQPDHFEKTRKNTQLIEINWLVKKGIAEGLIEIGREPQKVFWAKGGGYIGVYPQGVNPQDYLTDLALTNTEEGRNFKEQLKQVVQ